ncbi:MAG: dihydroneopterin aldolase [Firmicutes bacterium]|nr:dihydroneopterin aldolase [Bacillota bacterium]
MDKICLKNLSFFATHGVYEEEKQQQQQFIVQIEMSVDTRLAIAADDLNYSVDYGRVYMLVKQAVEENSFNLIETLAEYIAAKLLEDKKVRNVRVQVEKNNACYEGQFFSAAVVIERGGTDG